MGKYKKLTSDELQTKAGEAISLAVIVACSVMAVVFVGLYKLFQSYNGRVRLPGGFDLEWKIG